MAQQMMNETISFDDVLLAPQYSEIDSRSEIKIKQQLKNINHDFTLPIISSPMDTVTEADMAITIYEAGGLGVLHRYNYIEEQVSMASSVLEYGSDVGSAIGVNGDFIPRSMALVDSGVTILCIDVAHGHHSKVRYAIETLRRTYGKRIHIMAGNIATREGFNALADWGADSIRVGIGGGSICSTRVQTGHGVPTLQSIIDCAGSDRDVTLIADGGLRTSGDIVKALAAGADFVMLGSLLASTDEAPGEVVGDRKVYRGMASKEAQIQWRGDYSSVEGVSSSVPRRGLAENVLNELERGIRSGLSYSGARSIQELQAKAKFIRQTNSSQVESSTHIEKI